MPDNATDEQLIHLYQQGHTAAFEILYSRYKKAIYHYLFRQVHSGGIADELHQDVWLNMIKSSSRFKQQASFKTWLYKIAHNQLVDYYRQQSKQSLYLVQNHADEATHHDTAVDPDNKPDDRLQTTQISEALLQNINNLPAEQREVFVLHENSGLTLQDIARLTGSSYESTKSRLRYAIKKLRHHMAQYMADKQ